MQQLGLYPLPAAWALATGATKDIPKMIVNTMATSLLRCIIILRFISFPPFLTVWCLTLAGI